MHKIIVYVQGGVVTGVACNELDSEVLIIDRDSEIEEKCSQADVDYRGTELFFDIV